jgi:beta-lactamase superfamily II metal-dependent hydrolase
LTTDVFLLDVGHGNAALVIEPGQALVVDAPPNPTLIESLRHFGISRLTALIASHSDADHIGGLVNLMSSRQVSIETVYVNPDSDQTSASWRDFKFALHDRHCKF